MLHAECPAACILFDSVRDAAGTLLDFHWTALNPAAETLVNSLDVERALSSWGGAVEGLPERVSLAQVMDGGTPLSFEVHCRPGGEERWYQAKAVKHGDGFSLWLFDDTQAHLWPALEAAGVVTWEWSSARRTVFWSPNADAFFGHPPGGPGSTLASFLACVHPEDRTRVAEAIEQGLRADGPYTFQFRGQWPDGTVHCYEAVGQTVHEDHQPSRMLGVVRDCTERERTQAALREAEERYRLAAWATNDVLWDWKPPSDFIHWGEASFSAFGYPPEEMGGFAWWTEQLHPDDRQGVTEGLRQAVESGGDSWMAEYRFRRKDGTYAHVLDRGRVARDAKGHMVRMIGSMMDITERKLALERMREEARFRERFIGILGHDLRNPLNAIKLSVRALRRHGGLSPRQLQLTHGIEASVTRMGNMISDILDLTRARLSGGIPLRLASTSLPAVCRQVVEELSMAHPGRRITFEEQGEGQGFWDPERLAQVVSNLVGNALEHGAREETISVRCVGEPERQVLEVSNQGAPIPRHLLATLFDPFRQVDPAQGGRKGGLGLGLFIVREIVEAHGGQVSVRSTQEEGTTFTVVLPRDSRPREPRP
jgi:PAS domain S-box-containing protein